MAAPSYEATSMTDVARVILIRAKVTVFTVILIRACSSAVFSLRPGYADSHQGSWVAYFSFIIQSIDCLPGTRAMEYPQQFDFGFEAHWFFHKPVDINPSSYSSQV